MIGNYTAHKLLTNFQKFDFEKRFKEFIGESVDH